MLSPEEIEQRIGVHVGHCCRGHGCKYGDSTCPVVLELVQQDHGCDRCPSVQQVRDLGNLLAGIFDASITPYTDTQLVRNWDKIADLINGD